MNFFPITMSAAIVIAACVATGPTRISHSTIDRGYRLSEVALAGASGSLLALLVRERDHLGAEVEAEHAPLG